MKIIVANSLGFEQPNNPTQLFAWMPFHDREIQDRNVVIHFSVINLSVMRLHGLQPRSNLGCAAVAFCGFFASIEVALYLSTSNNIGRVVGGGLDGPDKSLINAWRRSYRPCCPFGFVPLLS